jgi:hypothetical protein
VDRSVVKIVWHLLLIGHFFAGTTELLASFVEPLVTNCNRIKYNELFIITIYSVRCFIRQVVLYHRFVSMGDRPSDKKMWSYMTDGLSSQVVLYHRFVNMGEIGLATRRCGLT